MRWEMTGGVGLLVMLLACGSTSEKPKSSAAGGASGSGGQSTGGAPSSGSGGTARAGEAGAGTGGSAKNECKETTNQIAGTTLKRRFWVTAEGDKGFDSFWDPKANAACDFNYAADGKARCIPNNWSNSAIYFTDPACQQPVYTRMADAPCSPRDYIMLLTEGGCNMRAGYDFYELGSKLAVETPVYALSGEACVATSRPVDDLFAKGAQVPPSNFLEGADPVDLDQGSRIRRYGVLGADGTQAVWGWRDSKLDGETCYFGEAEDGKQRCLPHHFASGYSDAACSMPLIAETTACEKTTVVNYVAVGAASDCGIPAKLFARGDEYTGTLNEGDAATCSAAATQPTGKVYATTPLESSTFEEAPWFVDESDPGRLKPRYWVGASGGCWFDGFFDSELKTECGFTPTIDGKTRCVPGDYMTNLNIVYSDADCSLELAIASRDECEDAEPPTYAISMANTERTCDRVYGVWKSVGVVSAEALPALYRGKPGACSAYVPDPGKYLTLEAVDPEAFMVGEPKVE